MSAHARLESDIQALSLRLGIEARRRNLRTLAFLGIDRRAGATTLCAFAAVELARQGRSVVLIDANASLPRLHRIFELPPSPGVGQVLAGEVELLEVIQRVGRGTLAVLPRGTVADAQPTPESWEKVLSHAADVGLVLVDAGGAAEPAALAAANAADAVVLVVEAGASRGDAVAAAVERVEQHGATLLGVVLNKWRSPIPEVFRRGRPS
jgi:Mrp family chromosome partitioning ATPase